MAWLYRRPDSGRWWIGYRANGVQFLTSTGQTDKGEAEKQLKKVEAMLAMKRADALTVEAFEQISGRALPAKALTAALTGWIDETGKTAGPRTLEKYVGLSTALTKHFRATDSWPLVSSITRDEMREFLNKKRSKTSPATGNMARKCLSVFFRWCKANDIVRDNPIEGIKRFEVSKSDQRVRRPFTVEEMNHLYQKAPNDFWRYMILAGFFTGLRLGDLATMPVGAVDLKARTINILTRKTGVTLHIPIATPLYGLLSKLLAERKGARATAPLWPEHAKRYEDQGAGWFGQRFYDLMLVKAGIAGVRSHESGGKSKADKRRVNEVSFHCLRHSYVSTLAALGQSQQIVKALAGHSSDEINDLYTKLPAEVLKPAIALLPDITKAKQDS